MLVIRVEHKDTGLGPYMHCLHKPNNALEELACKELMEPHHSDPKWSDGSNINAELYNFGFKDSEQFVNWFRKTYVIHSLHSFGFVVRMYESSDAQEINDQIIFVKEQAILVKELDLIEFWNNAINIDLYS